MAPTTKKTTKPEPDPEVLESALAVGESWLDVIKRKGNEGLPAHAALEDEVNVSPTLTDEEPEPEPEKPSTKEVKKADTK